MDRFSARPILVVLIGVLVGVLFTALPAIGSHSASGSVHCYSAPDVVGESSEPRTICDVPLNAPPGVFGGVDPLAASGGQFTALIAFAGLLAIGIGVAMRRRAGSRA